MGARTDVDFLAVTTTMTLGKARPTNQPDLSPRTDSGKVGDAPLLARVLSRIVISANPRLEWVQQRDKRPREGGCRANDKLSCSCFLPVTRYLGKDGREENKA
jgi:hypothetical protein